MVHGRFTVGFDAGQCRMVGSVVGSGRLHSVALGSGVGSRSDLPELHNTRGVETVRGAVDPRNRGNLLDTSNGGWSVGQLIRENGCKML
jgi:hypothetical protein